MIDTFTLADWSIAHIKSIFEDPSDKVSLKVLRDTFAHDVIATMNGTPLSRDILEDSVGALRTSAGEAGLSVEWKRAEGVPREGCGESAGTFSGNYIIRGIRKRSSPDDDWVEYERHKTVNVTIEPRDSDDADVDARKIVVLTCEAYDVQLC